MPVLIMLTAKKRGKALKRTRFRRIVVAASLASIMGAVRSSQSQ
jgi:hypothetical protein